MGRASMEDRNPADEPGLPDLTGDDVRRRKAFLEIGPRTEACLRRIRPILQRHATEIVDRLYEFLLTHEHTRSLLRTPQTVRRLKSIQRAYLERLTAGRYDLEYFKDRLKAGHAHDRIGLSPQWYLGAYRKYRSIIFEVLARELGAGSKEYAEATEALDRVMHLDMGLAMDAYSHAGKERLRLLGARKQLLTDMIVHDLRNPVAGIQGFLEILDMRRDSLTEGERRGLAEARQACSILNQMIDNVLDISRMEEGKLELVLESVDLKGLIDDTIRMLEPYARARSKELRSRHGQGSLVVRTDLRILQRILLNLVMNALRHARTATFVEVGSFRDGSGRPGVVVEDDGAGIAADLQRRVFDRYGAAGPRKAGVKADTGLGLAFCAMAAQELGLDLGLETHPGKGTRIRLTFPGG